MQLNKEERKAAYEWALGIVKKEAHVKSPCRIWGVCEILSSYLVLKENDLELSGPFNSGGKFAPRDYTFDIGFTDDILKYTDDMQEEFPEFYRQRPSQYGIFWWNEEDTASRIQALENAIKLCV